MPLFTRLRCAVCQSIRYAPARCHDHPEAVHEECYPHEESRPQKTENQILRESVYELARLVFGRGSVEHDTRVLVEVCAKDPLIADLIENARADT